MRIVLAEDQAPMRHRLAQLLTSAGFDVVATAADAEGLLTLTEKHRPELVITDIRMPPEYKDEGLRAAVRIKQGYPGIGVVLLSQHVQRSYTVELLRDHASGTGYLHKHRVIDIDTFTRDLQTVAVGGIVLDPALVALLMAQARSTSSEPLTPGQERVLACAAQGLTDQAIADELHVTETSVVGHLATICELLGLEPAPEAHRRVQALVQHLWH